MIWIVIAIICALAGGALLLFSCIANHPDERTDVEIEAERANNNWFFEGLEGGKR